jgi:phenylpropionate dioxygenase-like ring-hydroxylating dioxygenase large terminal subunit
MLSATDNELLTRTGPGTPMGELFRRFWQPALLSAELQERDGAPRRVTLLGEELLAFRGSDGRVGLVHPKCAHRGADLFFGRNEECGLRCAFHGWKYDVEGRCVDMPSVPPGASYQGKVRIKAYPTREQGGFIWAYLGPPAKMPPLPMLEFTLVPPEHLHVSKKLQECNWAQSCEGALDTAHFSYLHAPAGSAEEQIAAALNQSEASLQRDRVRWLLGDRLPDFVVLAHEAGLVVGASRKADGENLYWRVAQFLMPNHALSPSTMPGENYFSQSFVPLDDHHHWIYCTTWNPQRPISAEERERYRRGHTIHAAVDDNWVPLRNRANDYLIDRDEQKRVSYTGIRGVSEQDAAIQDSQGWIADRTTEHLGPTDLGIVRFRKLVLGAAKELAAGGEPACASAPRRFAVRSGGAVAHRDVPLAEVMKQRFGDEHAYVGETYGQET